MAQVFSYEFCEVFQKAFMWKTCERLFFNSLDTAGLNLEPTVPIIHHF